MIFENVLVAGWLLQEKQGEGNGAPSGLIGCLCAMRKMALGICSVVRFLFFIL